MRGPGLEEMGKFLQHEGTRGEKGGGGVLVAGVQVVAGCSVGWWEASCSVGAQSMVDVRTWVLCGKGQPQRSSQVPGPLCNAGTMAGRGGGD
jgi:hypothetical protein